ncbi:MAG: hypothetical protein GX620_03030 [Chloroflexi bacterium]|nr:hypothetical protein [Chloroflexota bacterium]
MVGESSGALPVDSGPAQGNSAGLVMGYEPPIGKAPWVLMERQCVVDRLYSTWRHEVVSDRWYGGRGAEAVR